LLRRRKRKRDRLPRDRFAGLAIPVVPRVVNENVLQAARDAGRCTVCGRRRPTEPHHIKSVGSGGGDTPENVLPVCRGCHDDIHRGNAPRDRLLALALQWRG
jgi:5-methylcytosine-specific restriction endonuclease McrA